MAGATDISNTTSVVNIQYRGITRHARCVRKSRAALGPDPLPREMLAITNPESTKKRSTPASAFRPSQSSSA